MSWNPDDDELVKVWLATQELKKLGKLAFNPSRHPGSRAPTTARDLLIETNERGLDLMQGGSCIYPPPKVLGILARERGCEPRELFTEDQVEAELRELRRVDALIAEADANDRPLAESMGRSAAGALGGWRTLFYSLRAFAIVLAPLALGLFLLERYQDHAKIFLGVFALGLAASARELLRGIFNPARMFRTAESMTDMSAASKQKVIGLVASDVAWFFALFVATAASYSIVDKGAFSVGLSEMHFVPLWMLYGIDNLVRTVGLDVAEVFRFQVSTVTHTDHVGAELLVFGFRTLFSVFGIALIAEAARRYSGTRPLAQ